LEPLFDKIKPAFSVETQLLQINPTMYMVRINDKMLCAPYFMKKGRDTHYEIFDNTDYLKDEVDNPFKDRLDLFEKCFNDKTSILSKPFIVIKK